jgi:hypothetical protein
MNRSTNSPASVWLAVRGCTATVWRLRPAFLLVSLWTMAVASAGSAATINVGINTLLPNTPNQTVEIVVVPDFPGEQIINLDFVAALAPPGSYFLNVYNNQSPPSNVNGPVFMARADIVGPGTVFADNNRGQHPGLSVFSPRFVEESTITNAGFVPASGMLARLTLDTTGITGEVGHDLLFPLSLGTVDEVGLPYATRSLNERGRPVFDFNEDGIPERITNGFIRIAAVPEPPA